MPQDPNPKLAPVALTWPCRKTKSGGHVICHKSDLAQKNAPKKQPDVTPQLPTLIPLDTLSR